jgi:RES domain-containing protein
MLVYRLCNRKYANDLSGQGAFFYGGRWNGINFRMLYTAQNASLALLESLVHFNNTITPVDFIMNTIEVPDTKMLELKLIDLPENWRRYPAPKILQDIGNHFLDDNKFLCMKVPSVVVNSESNYLINPLHADFKKVKIVAQSAFPLDVRFYKF